MDLLRCLILRQEWPIFYLRPCLFGWLDMWCCLECVLITGWDWRRKTVSHIRSGCPSKAAMPAWWTSLDVWFCEKSGQFSTWDHVCLVDLTCGAAWSVCWLQDETGDVNRFSHSQWVSEQGCNACMMDLLRCLILRQEWPIFYLRPCLFGWLDMWCCLECVLITGWDWRRKPFLTFAVGVRARLQCLHDGPP